MVISLDSRLLMKAIMQGHVTQKADFELSGEQVSYQDCIDLSNRN